MKDQPIEGQPAIQASSNNFLLTDSYNTQSPGSNFTASAVQEMNVNSGQHSLQPFCNSSLFSPLSSQQLFHIQVGRLEFTWENSKLRTTLQKVETSSATIKVILLTKQDGGILS